MGEPEYSIDGIKWESAMEVVRRRPAMWLGGVGCDGLHAALSAVVDNTIEDAIAGHLTRTSIALDADGGVIVEDDGNGLSVAPVGDTGLTALETVFTCFGDPRHGRSLYGTGVAVVTALSECLEVATSREGRRFQMRFERGRKVGGLEDLGATQTKGTRVRFVPDGTIFEAGALLDRARVVEEIHGLAALVPGLTLSLRDERFAEPFSATLQCPRGLSDLVQTLVERPLLAAPIAARTDEVAIAIQIDAARERIVGFANHYRTDEGTHVNGLIEGLGGRPKGLVAVLAVDLEAPTFDGVRRERLATESAHALVAELTRRTVAAWRKENPAQAHKLL